MKKLITITLLITFCSVFAISQNAMARSAGGGDMAKPTTEGYLIGGLIGVAIIAVVWIAGKAMGGSKKAKLDQKNKFVKRSYKAKSDQKNKFAKRSDLIPTDNRIASYSSHHSKDEGQTIALYAFKVEF